MVSEKNFISLIYQIRTKNFKEAVWKTELIAKCDLWELREIIEFLNIISQIIQFYSENISQWMWRISGMFQLEWRNVYLFDSLVSYLYDGKICIFSDGMNYILRMSISHSWLHSRIFTHTNCPHCSLEWWMTWHCMSRKTFLNYGLQKFFSLQFELESADNLLFQQWRLISIVFEALGAPGPFKILLTIFLLMITLWGKF